MHLRRAAIVAVALALLMSVPATAADSRYRACLDPGHGGTDPGATAGTLLEKELNLDIAQRVRAQLDPAVFNITLTRNDNSTTLGNSARAQICNAAAAQLVLSIHLNASTDTTVDYAWFFYGKPQKDKAFAATMDANYRILDAVGNSILVHKAITNFANGTLLKSNAPAALAEGLFMSNTDERALLAATDASSRRQQIADQLAIGIRAFAGR
ncbi:MAG: N-acetylmuramoyl-L-alanine amidase [Chloroflexota bacterium]|nr:N-acetylmuramoyl-L-alanine amidase [Chloroflexota bacterium]